MVVDLTVDGEEKLVVDRSDRLRARVYRTAGSERVLGFGKDRDREGDSPTPTMARRSCTRMASSLILHPDQSGPRCLNRFERATARARNAGKSFESYA